MNAAYAEPDVRLDAATRTLHAAFAVRNDTSRTLARRARASAWATTSSTPAPAR